MQVDAYLRVALVEMDVLWEEHGGVAVGVEGEHAVVHLMGVVIGQCLLDEPMEQGHALFQTLRMPLHTDDGFVFVALHGLDDVVGRLGGDAELRSSLAHSLMMEAVDKHFIVLEHLIEQRVFLDVYRMGHLATGCLLRMLRDGLLVDILPHTAAKGHRQGLDTATDAEDGHLTVVSHLGEHQFGQIALRIDVVQPVRRLLTAIEGVEVAATAQDEGVDMIEGVDERVCIGHRGDDNGNASCGHHRFIISLAQLTGQVFVVASDADDWLALCGRILCINVAQMGLQIESVCHSVYRLLERYGYLPLDALFE